ncbi:hypothetical protein FRB95_008287 [Tulasnella sp. JGI-2019a]|nr:hypothetical protein FRB95_008287 [Tulasnella sp. JGI-2019a]
MNTISVIKDAQHFVIRFSDPISLSVGCVCSSALPFTPKCHLYSMYEAELSDFVDVQIEKMAGWGPCLRVIQTGSSVKSAAFSPKSHNEIVRSVTFSPNGDQLASGSQDSTVRIWDVQTGAGIVAFQGRTTIRLWSLLTGVEVTVTKERRCWIGCAAFSPDDSLSAYGSQDGRVHIWDMRTSTEVVILEGHSLRIASLAFFREGHRLASSSFDYTARIWDMHTGALLTTLMGHEGRVCPITFYPQDDRLATGSNDSAIRLWNSATGVEISRLNAHPYQVTSVAFSPNGDRLVSGSDNQTIRLWDVHLGSIPPCRSATVI